MRHGCNLVAHPIKFAPRAWYKKGENHNGEFTRTGFQQNKDSDKPEDDTLGWIRKLLFESEFKQLPIAVSCNTWNAGSKYLALVGWVDEVTHKTNLDHLCSTAETEKVIVTEYDPALFDALPKWNDGCYREFKDDFEAVAEKTMMRKSIRAEQQVRDGRLAEKLERHYVKRAARKALPNTVEKQTADISSMFDSF